MFKSTSSTVSLRRWVALTAVLGASVTVMGAQALSSSSASSATQSTPVVQVPSLNVQAPSTNDAGTPQFSSSSAENNADAATGGQTVASLNPMPVDFAKEMQYGGGRRRYGSPRYRGSNTNSDGSPKYMFYAGVGLAQPSGNTFKYFTPSWGLQVGGGRQFNRHFAVPIEFDYDAMGLTTAAISDQAYIYTGDSDASDNDIGANAHVWSFSVDPRYTLFGATGDGFGMYALVDVGFYHKVTNFTTPEEEESYYGIYEVNANFDHYTSNAPGFGAGVGFTYKFSHFSNEQLYGEGRYIFVDNSQRTGYTAADAAAGLAYSGSDFFPANSNRTTYFPIKFGIRF